MVNNLNDRFKNMSNWLLVLCLAEAQAYGKVIHKRWANIYLQDKPNKNIETHNVRK